MLNITDKEFEEKIGDYERGLNDAWEIARRLSCCVFDGGMPYSTLISIFGCEATPNSLYRDYTASEVMAKIKEYEGKKNCNNCGQPRDYRGDCILYDTGKCLNEYEKWIPKE